MERVRGEKLVPLDQFSTRHRLGKKSMVKNSCSNPNRFADLYKGLFWACKNQGLGRNWGLGPALGPGPGTRPWAQDLGSQGPRAPRSWPWSGSQGPGPWSGPQGPGPKVGCLVRAPRSGACGPGQTPLIANPPYCGTRPSRPVSKSGPAATRSGPAAFRSALQELVLHDT